MTIIKFLFLIRACGATEPCLFVASFSTMFPTALSSVDSTFQRHIFLQNMESLRPSVGRISGKSEGLFKVLTEFSEATDMESESRSRAYWDILCGGGSIINGYGRS